MGVGLPPLEFTECMSDSPNFRENLHKHEKELENTSQQIKRLIKEVKDLLNAAKREYNIFLSLVYLGTLPYIPNTYVCAYVFRLNSYENINV